MLSNNNAFRNNINKRPYFDAFRRPKMRREFPRHNVNHEFKYSYNETESRCSILNISEGGMYLKIPQILELDDQIKLFFNGENVSFDIFGEIVHRDNNYVGIRYLEEDLYKHSYIKKYINEIKKF